MRHLRLIEESRQANDPFAACDCDLDLLPVSCDNVGGDKSRVEEVDVFDWLVRLRKTLAQGQINRYEVASQRRQLRRGKLGEHGITRMRRAHDRQVTGRVG